jgi:hypothetical protein
MLVYANSFEFEPEDGPQDIIRLTARWLKQKTNVRIDPDRLAHGIRRLRFKDASFVSSESTPIDDPDNLFPYLFNARYTHGDHKISGRRWTTEIGLRQNQQNGRVECSILLRTEEMSTKVTSPIQVTRPRLIVDLVEYCRPVAGTPGLYTKKLTVESCEAFQRELERLDRRHPFVVISADNDGRYHVDPERFRSLLLGLADIVVIPPEEDTIAIEGMIGRRYTPFNGAVKIIFPRRRNSSEHHQVCEKPRSLVRGQEHGRRRRPNGGCSILNGVPNNSNGRNSAGM